MLSGIACGFISVPGTQMDAEHGFLVMFSLALPLTLMFPRFCSSSFVIKPSSEQKLVCPLSHTFARDQTNSTFARDQAGGGRC